MRSKSSTLLQCSALAASACLLGSVCIAGCNQTLPRDRYIAQVLGNTGTDLDESALVIDLGYIDLRSNVAFGLPLSRHGLPPDANIATSEASVNMRLRCTRYHELSCILLSDTSKTTFAFFRKSLVRKSLKGIYIGELLNNRTTMGFSGNGTTPEWLKAVFNAKAREG